MVSISGSSAKIGGIAGESVGGIIEYCLNYNSISGRKYTGGICGYSNNTLIECCGNRENGYIESTYGYTGGIVGYVGYQVDESEYAVGKCYNYGTIESSTAVAGIVGGAWNEDGQTITIKTCYNTGTILCEDNFNGGILGGTYNLFDEENLEVNRNVVFACYNIGTIESSLANQISSKYADVRECYYITLRTNLSEYGYGKFEVYFKKSNASSVYTQIGRVAPGCWVLNENNNGYVSLAWQNE